MILTKSSKRGRSIPSEPLLTNERSQDNNNTHRCSTFSPDMEEMKMTASSSKAGGRPNLQRSKSLTLRAKLEQGRSSPHLCSSSVSSCGSSQGAETEFSVLSAISAPVLMSSSSSSDNLQLLEEVKLEEMFNRPIQTKFLVRSRHSRKKKSRRKRGNSLEREISRLIRGASEGTSEAISNENGSAEQEMKSAQFILSDLDQEVQGTIQLQESVSQADSLLRDLDDMSKRPPNSRKAFAPKPSEQEMDLQLCQTDSLIRDLEDMSKRPTTARTVLAPKQIERKPESHPIKVGDADKHASVSVSASNNKVITSSPNRVSVGSTGNTANATGSPKQSPVGSPVKVIPKLNPPPRRSLSVVEEKKDDDFFPTDWTSFDTPMFYKPKEVSNDHGPKIDDNGSLCKSTSSVPVSSPHREAQKARIKKVFGKKVGNQSSRSLDGSSPSSSPSRAVTTKVGNPKLPIRPLSKLPRESRSATVRRMESSAVTAKFDPFNVSMPRHRMNSVSQ